MGKRWNAFVEAVSNLGKDYLPLGVDGLEKDLRHAGYLSHRISRRQKGRMSEITLNVVPGGLDIRLYDSMIVPPSKRAAVVVGACEPSAYLKNGADLHIWFQRWSSAAQERSCIYTSDSVKAADDIRAGISILITPEIQIGKGQYFMRVCHTNEEVLQAVKDLPSLVMEHATEAARYNALVLKERQSVLEGAFTGST